MFPFLSLEHLEIDVAIAQRLSRRLAYYHLALPIAEDAEGMTVAMAHPDNENVVSVLEAALQVKVIPVQSFAETIRQQLDRIWQVQHPVGALRVVLGATSVELFDSAGAYVGGLLAALGREAQIERLAVDEPLLPTASGELVVMASAETALPPIASRLFRAPASLLLLRSPAEPPRTILHVLRGHIPDYRVLDWLVPLARRSAADVTLFMGIDDEGETGGRKPLVSDLSSILMGRDQRQAHVAACRRILTEAGIHGRLKLRQGALLSAVGAELAEQRYDLVAIAAEAYGDFAQQVGALVWTQTTAFLVLKP